MNTRAQNDKLKVLDLFSGIGGFSLGLERTGGFETVAFCEIDPFCQQVLAKHWPDVPIETDVRLINGSKYSADVVCGGYPCQPFSYAGKRGGDADDRHLWPEMFRVIKECRPAWVIGENVAGHVTMGLDEVLSDLEGEGYACQAFIIPACAVDAPHRRDRVWIVGHSKNKSRRTGVRESIKNWSQFDYASSHVSNARGEQHESSCDAEQWAPAEKLSMADSIKPRLQRHAGNEFRGTRRKETNRSTSAGSVFRRGNAGPRWAVESGFCRVANGVPRRLDRLRALGNAVVPQIPQAIGEAILEAIR